MVQINDIICPQLFTLPRNPVVDQIGRFGRPELARGPPVDNHCDFNILLVYLV